MIGDEIMRLSIVWNAHRFRCYLYCFTKIIKKMSYEMFCQVVANAKERYRKNGHDIPDELNMWRLRIDNYGEFCNMTYSYNFYGEVLTFKENNGLEIGRLLDNDNIKVMTKKFREHARNFVTITALTDYPTAIRNEMSEYILRFAYDGKIIQTWKEADENLRKWILNPVREKLLVSEEDVTGQPVDSCL